MNRFIRFYNQNRYMVWIIILSIVAFIALIRILNNFAYEVNNANKKNNNVNSSSTNFNYAVITEEEVGSDISEVIEEFIEYCTNGQVENAYSLLSDECKIILYPSLEDFTRKIL